MDQDLVAQAFCKFSSEFERKVLPKFLVTTN